MRITYNAPFILTFTIVSGLAYWWGNVTGGESTLMFFTLAPDMSFRDPLTYVRLFSYAAGHVDWRHLSYNFTIILLLGPILEEKYGTNRMIVMSLVTILITALLNSLFFTSGLLGASGIVFMLILLSSFTNMKAGSIPLTFLLILFFFLGQEILNIFHNDNVSQFAHIVGGVCGSIFGFIGTDGTA